MAERQLQNASLPDTTIAEPLATSEQQEPAPKPARRRQQSAKNGATPKQTHSKKSPKPVESAISTRIDVASDASQSKRTPLKKSTSSTRRKTAKSIKEQEDIPNTPLPPTGELANIPNTPPPSFSEQDALTDIAMPTEDEAERNTVVIEEEVEVVILTESENTPVTPWKWSEVESALPLQISEAERLTPPAIVIVRPQARPLSRRPAKQVAMLLTLMLFISSSLLLWLNVNQTHLYLYHLDPNNGQMLAQQDLGNYSSISSLSNAAQDLSTLYVGVSTSPSAQQRVLALTGSDTSWHVTRQLSAPPASASLSVGPDHLLASENGNGLQVMTGDGRVLWHAPGDGPILGEHAFRPAFDSSNVYTIKSARQGIVAAYNAHSGAAHWIAHIDDTLNYAPPLLLIGDTLYVAGDHTLYALNTTTGGVHWKIATSTRTLLFSQASTPALIAVGASGIQAFDARSGNLLWSFNGQPETQGANGDTLTAAQFYQAGLLTTSNTLYATGILWNAQQAQQQLWLFAVDAGSGKLTWSKQIGSGFTNADGGRVFAPFIDAPHKLIVIEQAQADGSHSLSAFDSGDGIPRWHIRLASVTASTPDIFQLSSASLSIFSAQTDAGLSLRSSSWLHLLLIALDLASLLALALLWILPLRAWLNHTRRRIRRLPHYGIAPLRGLRRLWRFSRLLFALAFIAVSTGAGILAYTQLNQPLLYIRQVGTDKGNALWQHAASSSTTLASVDNQGTLLLTDTGDHIHKLSYLNSSGSSRWVLPSGEAIFSFPQVTTAPGTVLAVLHGPATLDYHYAPDDPAYQNPLAHYFALYLLDSNTGRVLWHNDLARAGALQDARVLGADSQFIYIASRSLQNNHVAQLIAVDKTSGMTAWRIYGPREQANPVPDYGALLIQASFIYWQVDNAVYALNPQTGQIAWRDAIPEVNASATPLEEGQVAAGAGTLLIRRSDMYHALDLVTGTERWTLSGLGVDNPQTPGGIVSAGSKFIVYGGGSIEAYDTTTQSILWKHIDLVAVSNVALSSDGALVYAVVFNNVERGTNEQALVAFDVNSNLIHWTFQPGAQAQFVYAGSHIIYNARGRIYAVTCFAGNLGTCNHQVLYSIDEKSGVSRWQIAAQRISALALSSDGNGITFQTESSAWENLKALFRG